MLINTIKDLVEFEALEVPWNDCLAAMPSGNPFLSHHWLRAWWMSRGEGRELMVLLVRDGETILAAAPLFRSRLPYYGLPCEQILFIGTHTFDRLSFLHRTTDLGPLQALWDHLRRSCAGRILVRLEELPEDALTLAIARDLPGPRADEVSSTLPYIPADRSWDEYRHSLTHKFRSEMRTRVKVFARWGDWRLDVNRGGGVSAFLDELAAVERESSKQEAGTGFLSDDRNRDFMRRVLDDSGPTEPVLLQLRIDERLIAYVLGFIHGRVFCAYNTAYLPGFEKGSPGKWIMDQAVKFTFDEGLDAFDFLRGQFGYKQRWQPRLRRSRRCVLLPRNPLGWLLRIGVFELRPGLKRLLGLGG